ncbi:DUF1330 domain-containing protein [Chitinophaga sp. GCM10012297]|uniref:DUF1330 domain-containing protein n=1 Tax=Chitinophaga chungangae TaxID=2821488 RepID=A0ABS3YIR9_9BACT|nr:hypothetical protein [Chitinophaga chungangae]MBO9153984.1 hypothetical protein [Chitinophaga chungangae]
MIYITQLVYIHPGMESTFGEFESVALPLVDRYNGKLLLRIRPEENSMIAGTLERPYEVHLVSFKSEADFERFKADPSREGMLHLKDLSVRKMVLIRGMAL